MGGISSLLGGGGIDVPAYEAYSTRSGFGDVAVKDNLITTTLAPEYQDIVNRLRGAFQASPSYSEDVLGAGRTATGAGAGFLESLGSYDPFAAAETQFQRMEEILAPGRERDRSALEARLLRQGRLGSTGGGRQQEALETAIEQSRRAGLVEALTQAQGIQRQKAELGTALGAFGAGIEDQQLQRMLESLGAATAVEALPLEAGKLGATLSRQRSAHQLGKAELEAANQGAGWGDLLGGALTGAATAFAGPLGGAAADYMLR